MIVSSVLLIFMSPLLYMEPLSPIIARRIAARPFLLRWISPFTVDVLTPSRGTLTPRGSDFLLEVVAFCIHPSPF